MRETERNFGSSVLKRKRAWMRRRWEIDKPGAVAKHESRADQNNCCTDDVILKFVVVVVAVQCRTILLHDRNRHRVFALHRKHTLWIVEKEEEEEEVNRLNGRK